MSNRRTDPDRTVWIYGLKDPRTQKFRYVGRSCRPWARLKAHLKGDDTNTYKKRWIAQLDAAGLEPILVLLEQTTESGWRDLEQFWEQHLREQGEPLTNLAECGKGWSWPYKREDSSERMRALWADPDFRARMIAKRTGEVRSEDARRRMSEAQKGKVFSPESRAKMSLSAENRFQCVWGPFKDTEGRIWENIRNLEKFCRVHSLNPARMRDVQNGDHDHHGGWTCSAVEAQEGLERKAAAARAGLDAGIEKRRGQKRTPEQRRRIGDGHRGKPLEKKRKLWDGLVDPYGRPYPPVIGIESLCAQFGLSPSSMSAIHRGARRSHMGWTCPTAWEKAEAERKAAGYYTRSDATRAKFCTVWANRLGLPLAPEPPP